MPIVSNLLTTNYTQDDIEASPESVRGATIEQAKSDLLGPSILRSLELVGAGSTYGRAGGAYQRRYKADEATRYMDDAGLSGQFTFDRDYTEGELKTLAARKRAEMQRQSILSRADQSPSAVTGRLGLQLMTSFLDPLTVATAFVPVVSGARYAKLLEGAGGALGRAGVRAGVGAAEGAVGSALVEPIIAGAHYQEQADYTLADSLLNIGIGGVLGGGLHTVGGAIKDFRNPRAVELTAKIDEIAPTVSPVDTELLGRIDAAKGELSAANVEALRVANEILDREASGLQLTPEARETLGRWGSLETELTNIRAAVDSAGSAVSKMYDPATLQAEIARVTGDQTYMAYLRKRYNTGDVSEYVERRAKQLIKAQRKEAESQLNELRDQLADVQRQTDSARQANSAETRLSQIERARKTGDVESMLDALPQDVEPRIRARLNEAKQAASDFLNSDAVKALESNQARTQVATATPDIREAALKSAVSQAVTGQPIETRPIYDRTTLPEAAGRFNDPDQRPLSDPAAVKRSNDTIAAGDAADDAAIEKQVQDLDEQFKAMQAEAELLGDEDMAAMVAAINEEFAQAQRGVREASSHAQMLAVCAARSAT